MPRNRRQRSATSGAAPAQIADKLQELISRVRRVQLIRGGFATIGTAALALIICMAINAIFTIVSPRTHAAITGAALLAVIAVAYRTLFLPLREKISVGQMARIVESREPKLYERLSTALDLLSRDGEDNCSADLSAKLIDSAISDAKSIRPKRVFTNHSAHRPMLTALAAAVVIGLTLLIFPTPAKRLLTRSIAPFSSVGNAYADRIEVSPGDLRVPEGDPVTITATVSGKNPTATEIRRRSGSSTESVETMSLVSRDELAQTATYEITFPSVRSDFRYRIRSGRSISGTHELTAASRPDLRRLEVIYHYPEYTAIPTAVRNGTAQPIIAVTGTEIEINANFDRPLESAVFKLDGNPLPTNTDDSDEKTNPRASWRFTMADRSDGTWAFALVDKESIPSAPISGELRSIPDSPPALRILMQADTLRVRPTDQIEIRYEVVEDFAVSEMALHLPTQRRVIPQPLPKASGAGKLLGTAELDLGNLDLPDSNTFQLFLEVADSRPHPQKTKSSPLTIIVDPNADSLAEQFVAKQREDIDASLQAALKALEHVKPLTQPLAQQLLKPETIPAETLENLDTIQRLVADAERSIRRSAADAAAPSSVFQAIAPHLHAIANDHIAPALQAAGEIALSDEQRTRVHRAHLTHKQVEEAIADIQVAARELRGQSAHARLLAKMSDLGQQQSRLADALSRASLPETHAALRAQQAELAKAMQELAQSTGRSVSDQLEDARHNSNQLSKAARFLAEQQSDLNQQLANTQNPKLLAEKQSALADRAADLAENAGSLLKQTGPMADPAAREQMGDARDQADQAANSARDASTQLGGGETPGGFTFAMNPGTYADNENHGPTAPPVPTQAGLSGSRALPDESPFSEGSASADERPPAFSNDPMQLSGGTAAPSESQNEPDTEDQALATLSPASGSETTASGARESAMQSERSLNAAASALSNAATSLAQQASAPRSQTAPQLSEQMLDAARKAAQVAIEKNPELAKKIAQAVADNLTQDRPTQVIPPPDIEDWQDVRGQIKSGVASSEQGATPDGYRNLVKRYFREIARRSKEQP